MGGLGGSIVNISSGSAFIPGSPILYAVSKGALNSMQCSAVPDAASHGVRLNTVSPGMVDTDMPSDDIKKKYAPKIPLGRVAKVEEIANTIVFFLSNEVCFF